VHFAVSKQGISFRNKTMRVQLLLGVVASIACFSPAIAAKGPSKDGLALWLEADKGLATDGSTWADQSGNGHGATAVTGEAPLFVPAAINGLPAAQFSGSSAMSISGSLLTSQQFTIITVVTDASAYDGNNLEFREIVSNWSSSAPEESVFLGDLWTDASGKTSDRIRFTDAVGGEDQGDKGVGKIKRPTEAFILSATSGADNATVQLGSKVQYQSKKALTTRDLAEAWYLSRQGEADVEHWNGYIAEVLVYNKALSDTELKKDVAYLKGKWQ
jgi:hypothetical protein